MITDFKIPKKPGWLFVLPWEVEELGGVNRVVLELCKAQYSSEDFEPYVLIADWSAKDPVVTRKLNYTEIRMRLRCLRPWAFANWRDLLMFFLSLPVGLYRLYKLFARFNINVVNPHYPTEIIGNFILAKYFFKSPKLVVSFHGTDVLNIKRDVKLKAFWSRLLNNTDVIVACSEGLLHLLNTTFNNMHVHMTFVSNGVSSTFLESYDDAFTPISDELIGIDYLLCVGSFDEVKGQDLLIKAFSIIGNEYPNLKLVLIGRDGDLFEKCQAIINKLNLSDKVTMIAGVEHKQLKAYYQKAKLYVSASRHESFPLCLLESAIMKTPIVATKTIGSTSIIVSDSMGILVTNGDVTALAQGITKMLDDVLFQKQCTEKLNSHVIKNYTWEKALTKYVNLVAETR